MHYQPQLDLLQNRIILVTGASDGIGQEAALTYARHGASVILLGRSDEKLRAVAEEINQAGAIPARWFMLDLLTCTPQACQQLAQQITEQIGLGVWLPGDRLPSLREQVVSSGMSFMTVSHAYQLLESQGRIIARPQSGYYVAPQPIKQRHQHAVVDPLHTQLALL